MTEKLNFRTTVVDNGDDIIKKDEEAKIPPVEDDGEDIVNNDDITEEAKIPSDGEIHLGGIDDSDNWDDSLKDK